jgi:hypothetical protein
MSVKVNHNKAFGKYSNGYKAVNMLFLYTGAAAMAVLAKWA